MEGKQLDKMLYIVRHGETDYNKKGMVQGRGIDSSLNAKGLLQANKFYLAYKHCRFHKIYLSSLKRTKQSLQKFIDSGIPYEILDGLDEISWGCQEGLAFTEANQEIYRDTIRKWKSGDLDVAVEGGESPNQVMARQKESLGYILRQKEEKEILICMHGRAIRILISWILNKPLFQMDNFSHHNLGLYQLKFINNSFKLTKENDISHLSDII